MWMWIPFHYFKRRACFYGLLAWLWLPVIILAQGSYSALNIPYHVRSLSMSSVGVADPKGMDISGSNPSLLASANRKVILSVIRYPASIQSELVEWRTSWGTTVGAVTLRHLGYGTFQKRDREGMSTGQFSAGETWVSASLARSILRRIDLGITAGALFSQIADVTATLAILTVGGTLNITKLDMKLGFSLRNIGLTLDAYTSHSEPIPTNMNVGVMKKLAYLPLDLSIDGAWWGGSNSGVMRMGGEFTLPYDLRLRLGTTSYRFDQKTNQVWRDIATGTSIGLGYQTDKLSVDLGIQYGGVSGSAMGVGFSADL